MDSQSQAELIRQAIASCERAIALLQEEIDASEEIDPLVLCQPLDTAIQQTLDVGKTKGDLHDELMNLSESQDVSSFTEGNQTLAKPQPGLLVKLADASSMTTKMDEKKIFNNNALNTSPDWSHGELAKPPPPPKPPDRRCCIVAYEPWVQNWVNSMISSDMHTTGAEYDGLQIYPHPKQMELGLYYM